MNLIRIDRGIIKCIWVLNMDSYNIVYNLLSILTSEKYYVNDIFYNFYFFICKM